MNYKKRFNKKEIMIDAMLVILATIIFITTYGHHVLSPSYIWLNNYLGDITQHYYGWIAFRDSDWMFPLGLFDRATYPDATSIIFTDSIPG